MSTGIMEGRGTEHLHQDKERTWGKSLKIVETVRQEKKSNWERFVKSIFSRQRNFIYGFHLCLKGGMT